MKCRMLTLNSEQEWLRAGQWLKGRTAPDADVEKNVREMLAAVREKGDAALCEYTRRFDCPDFAPPLRVNERDIACAAAQTPPEHREYILSAAANIRAFHQAQKERSWFTSREDGSILGQRVTPVDAVGLYVPGGQGGATPLVSSLLMNAIPAQVAGVPRIAVCTPPCADGGINPVILAAAHLLDIDEIYRVGGAWAIAALSYGTESLAAVDVVAGPGNIWVTTAKRLCHGSVGIDMIAGPSEVLILADAGANPVLIAADMLAQAEHDPLASALCVTDSPALAERLQAELQRQCVTLPRTRTAARSLMDWGAIVIVPNMRTAVAIANQIAPEHLEICAADPWALLPGIRHAGAVFLGQYSAEAVGDYIAGPNHVLPTMGTARFASALSVQTFCKKTSILALSPDFVRENAAAVAGLSRLEGLEAHARSVEVRLP
ncbi:MAG: histidinol dehydrogenase [Desulfovibrio sp.]|nr:histidinol dehydrogenase [Desulfovibrio sp.]